MKRLAVVHNTARRGYVFLISVLFIGVIAAGVAAVLALMGTSMVRSTITVEDAAVAIAYARTCEERALRSLRADLDYAGNQTFLFADGICRILAISGTGNDNRNLCIEGRSGDAVRRLEIAVAEVLPAVRVRKWREVGTFTVCVP